MPHRDSRIERFTRVRAWRTGAPADQSLGFMRAAFKTQIAKPHKQLRDIIVIWQRLLPADIAAHTRLEGLTRGVLRIAVDSSPRLYEVDRLLRPAIRKVQLRVDASFTREA